METIREILNTPINNISREYYTFLSRFLNNSDNFIVRGEFDEDLYECVRDFYLYYLNQTEPIHIDDEPEPIHRDDKPKPLKSFRTDTCVICLTKPPNVLFTDCRHICICLECEKIKPLGKCPYCKTTISTKIIV